MSSSTWFRAFCLFNVKIKSMSKTLALSIFMMKFVHILVIKCCKKWSIWDIWTRILSNLLLFATSLRLSTYLGQIVAEINNSWCICCYIYNLGALKVDAKTSSENYKKALEACNKGIKGLVGTPTLASSGGLL